MKCQLCKINEADKTNTHYLSDNIIRLALNEKGSNIREKGFYFNISTDEKFVDFNFQRNTSIPQIEDHIKREISDLDIEKSTAQTPFSVDYIFCSKCEKIFTEIENNFNNQILVKFRNSDLDNVEYLEFLNENEQKTLRLYFYLQIWRSAICDDNIDLDETTKESLSHFILNYNETNIEDLKVFPICIVYLQTKGEAIEYTRNPVGTSNDKNPFLILMNDFIIQFFNDVENVNKIDFNGLNNFNFEQYLNINGNFKIKVFSNEKRIEFINSFLKNEKVERFVSDLISMFILKWKEETYNPISTDIISEFMQSIYESNNVLNLSEEFINTKITEIINKHK
jgi:hypothetical protein